MAAEPALWRLSDTLWERLAEAGLAAFEAGECDDAGALWMAALAHAERFDGDDPRRAATLNNLAAVRHRRGGAGEAEGFYGAAVDAWRAAEAWVGRMALSPRARSSLFHLRLEQKHREAYRCIARAEMEKLLHEGHAATLGNLAALRRAAGKADEASALETAAAERAPRGVKPGPERWAVMAPAALGDERKLATAALLLAIARHPL